MPIERKVVIIEFVQAGMAELADALDLGSSVPDVQVQVLLPAWNLELRVLKNQHSWLFFVLKF